MAESQLSTAPLDSAPSGPGSNYRWVICALLFFATTVNYIDRQILSLLKPILDDQLKWTNEEFGMVNSAFQGAYAFGLLFFGWFVNRFGAKIGYTVSIIAWSIAAMGHALVGSVNGFLAARVSLGLGEGGNFPSAVPAVAQWFPKRERAFATTIFNAGTNVGAIIAPAIIPPIAFTMGWHWAFIFAGIAGFIWLLFWIPFYSSPEKSRFVSKSEMELICSDRDESQNTQKKVGWLKVLKYRAAWSFVVGKFMTDPVWWFFLIWLPDFFKKTLLLDIKVSWVHLVTIYSIVTVLSIAGGWLTGYLNKRGWTVTRARKTGMFICAVCVVPVMFVTSFGKFDVNAEFFEKLKTATYSVPRIVKVDGKDKKEEDKIQVPSRIADELKPLSGKSYQSVDEFLKAARDLIYPERTAQLQKALAGKTFKYADEYVQALPEITQSGAVRENVARLVKESYAEESNKAKKDGKDGKIAVTVDEFIARVRDMQADEIKQPLADCARDNALFWIAVLLIGLAGAAHQAWSANLYTTCSDLFPKYAVASLIGIGGMAGSFGGMLFPIYTGKLLDYYKKIGNVTAGYTVLFTICAFAYLLAFVIHHALAPKFTQINLDAEENKSI